MLSRAQAFRAVATLLGANDRKRLALLNSLTEERWLATIAAANDHLVGPTLYAEAAERQWLHLMPDDVRHCLGEQHRLNVARNRRIREQLVECLECLNAAGLVPLLLKGAASMPDARDPGARVMRDIDLLIPKEDAERAAHALNRLGYRAWTLEFAGQHAFGILSRPGDPAALDLHIETMELSHVLPASSVWNDCRRVQIGRGHAFVPSRRHRFLHMVMHAMVHDEAYIRGFVGLRALHDFDRAASDLSDEWPDVRRDLARRGAIPPFNAMAFASMRLLGTRLPPMGIGRAASRIFYARAALRRHGLLPDCVNLLWTYAHKALAGYYFDPARDARPLAIWRIRRVARFARRAASRLRSAALTAMRGAAQRV